MATGNTKMERNLGESINFCHSVMVDISKRIEEQEQLAEVYHEKIEKYEKEIKIIKEKNYELENRFLCTEYYFHINCVEILQTPNEGMEEIVVSFNKTLG